MNQKAMIFFLVGSIVMAALIPLAIIADRRYERTAIPRIAIIPDMNKMAYLKPERSSPLFADHRAMRPHIRGTMAQEDFIFENQAEQRAYPNNWKKDHVVLTSGRQYQRVMYGQVLSKGQASFITHIPIPVTRRFVQRGQEQFDIFCEPCHGYNGQGNGTVNIYDSELRANGDTSDAGTWVQPSNLTQIGVQALPDGGIYNVITNGIAAMAAYKDQIPVVDRWAIVSYVRVLGLAQKKVPAYRLPASVRTNLNSKEKQKSSTPASANAGGK